jgi:hypothetical protein
LILNKNVSWRISTVAISGRFLFYPLLMIVSLAVAPLLKKGGAPVETKDETVFPTRPGTKVMYYLVMILGLGACFYAPLEQNVENACLAGGIGFSFFLMALFGLSMKYSVDVEGVHYRRFFRETTIPWHDLDHYERALVQQFGSEQIWLRSSKGTSINIMDIGIDTAAFMARVQSTHHLKEQPYQRHHWWGG